MAYPYRMTDIKRAGKSELPPLLRGRTLLIPGGWQAMIPEVTVEAEILDRYTAAWQRANLGMDEGEAWQKAWYGAQRLFRASYVKGLREFVTRRACDYAQLWPSLIDGTTNRNYYTLIGYAPEEIYHYYTPHLKTGLAGMWEGMEEMRGMATRAMEVKA